MTQFIINEMYFLFLKYFKNFLFSPILAYSIRFLKLPRGRKIFP